MAAADKATEPTRQEPEAKPRPVKKAAAPARKPPREMTTADSIRRARAARLAERARKGRLGDRKE